MASLLTAARRHSTAALSAALGPGAAATLGGGTTTLSAASDLSATKLSATLNPGTATTLAALDFHTATASAFDLDTATASAVEFASTVPTPAVPALSATPA
jgi:hypothetical protein